MSDVLERIDRSLDAMEESLSFIIGVQVRSTIGRHAGVIVGRLGLRYRNRLIGQDIIDLTHGWDTTDIEPVNLRKLWLASLVLQADDADGTMHYVTVEAGHVANLRTTRRAIRNAGYLTRFTGLPAHAVVAALRKDREIQPAIDSGRALWHQLDEDDDYSD